ncbi:MAG TPA: hypothetical protein VLT59_14060, partial [Steroidobacteraceae bacterium]|nr:hypothetical protein [Steroidobacteraceae bacterium]
VEQHIEYTALDDDEYWRARQWIAHERPTEWVLELARKKTLELKALFEARDRLKPGKVAEALELAIFLANLVGAEHVQRFIPLIVDTEPAEQAAPTASDTQRVTRLGAPPEPDHTDPGDTQRQRTLSGPQPARDASDTGTREMPRPAAPGPESKALAPRRPHHAHARTAGRIADDAGKPREAEVPSEPPAPASRSSQTIVRTVIADAVRLLKWGREWHELAEAVARMSGRPALGEVREILRDNRKEIERKAASRSGR